MCYGAVKSYASSVRAQTVMSSQGLGMQLQQSVSVQPFGGRKNSLSSSSSSYVSLSQSGEGKKKADKSRHVCLSSTNAMESTFLTQVGCGSKGASVSKMKKKSGPYSQPLSRHWLINAVPKLVSKLNKSTSSSLQRGEGAVTTAFVCNETLQEPLTRVHNSNPDEKDFDNWNVILNEVGAMEDGDDLAGVLVVKSLDKLECPAAKKKRAVTLPSTLTGSIGDCCEGEEEELEDMFLGYEDLEVLAKDNSEEVLPSDRTYGVVLQSKTRNPIVDGCYILRTSTSRSAGCQCTHYSMSRALCATDGSCMSVEEQLDKAWLVNPFSL